MSGYLVLAFFAWCSDLLGTLLAYIAKLNNALSLRLNFELRNNHCPYTQKTWPTSDRVLGFEVASEGELEQVLPLIEACWQQQWKVELIFASPSVEHKILALAKLHAQELRILRLPLLTARRLPEKSLRAWMSAECLILCRYDFYPTVLWAGLKPGRRLALVSATLKGKSDRSLPSQLYRWLYRQLSALICATQTDVMRVLREMGLRPDQVIAHDFRPLRIARRLKQADSVLTQRLTVTPLLTWFQHWIYERRIILGSAWAQDLELFNHASFCQQIAQGQWGILILAHDLADDNLAQLARQFEQITAQHANLPWYTWHSALTTDEQGLLIKTMQQRPGVICLNAKGILVELYRLAFYAHVGGGHGRSVHSVLEPYLAGCLVSCGPRVQRSTEVDLIQEQAPERLRVLSELATWADPVLIQARAQGPDFLPSDEKFSLMERTLEQDFQAALGFLFKRVLNQSKTP